jgi:hypothetical protein
MNSPLLPVGVVQNAYVVPDLAAACHSFHQVYHIGPFFRGKVHPLRDVYYRGAPATEPVVIEIACAQSGDLQIELLTRYPQSGEGAAVSSPLPAVRVDQNAYVVSDLEADRHARSQ